MGCGGSKEAVATGNTSRAGGGGNKLLRRKSSDVSTGAASTSSPSSSSGNTGGGAVAVKDVVKDATDAAEVTASADDAEKKPVSVDSKADAIVVMSLEKPAKAVAEDVASAPTPAAAAMASEANKVVVVVEEEEPLPESTMADEAPVEEAPQVDQAEAKELAPLKLNDGEKTIDGSKNVEEDEHKATSPAPTNEDGESAGQMQNTTEPVEAKPGVDEHVAEEATVVPAPPPPSAEEKTATDEQTQTAATVASEAPTN